MNHPHAKYVVLFLYPYIDKGSGNNLPATSTNEGRLLISKFRISHNIDGVFLEFGVRLTRANSLIIIVAVNYVT